MSNREHAYIAHSRSHAFKNEEGLCVISCDHIDRSRRTEQLLERGIHAYLSCLSDVVCGLTLLERGIHAYLSCLSEHAHLVIFSVSHELTFPCGKACLWPHAFRTRYTCIFVLFV